MNKKDLFSVIGDISDELITEANDSAKKVKRIRVLKVASIAAALVLLASITVWASSSILSSRIGHTSNIPDYYSAPSSEVLQNDVGINTNILEDFKNGYTFKSASIGYDTDYDDNGNVLEKYKSLECTYKRDNENLSLFIDAAAAGIGLEDAETANIYNGCAIKYLTYANKLVPGDYTLTEQDKEDERSGKYIFSYGSDDIKIINVQIIAWEYNNINYTICAIDSSLDCEQLLQMAKEIIDYQAN